VVGKYGYEDPSGKWDISKNFQLISTENASTESWSYFWIKNFDESIIKPQIII
jgi:hypothetical protein